VGAKTTRLNLDENGGGGGVILNQCHEGFRSYWKVKHCGSMEGFQRLGISDYKPADWCIYIQAG
jgi:hypothetical protein